MKFFRRILKAGKNFTKKPWKTAKKIESKALKTLKLGKKYLADTMDMKVCKYFVNELKVYNPNIKTSVEIILWKFGLKHFVQN